METHGTSIPIRPDNTAATSEARRRRFVAIINPISGRRDMRPVVKLVGQTLAHYDAELEIIATDGPGRATAIATGLGTDVDAVLIVGGDGTVCEVINGLTRNPKPFVILRTGTENLLARELNMPTEPNEIARALLVGQPRPLDLGVMNDRRFVAVTGIGFDAECVKRMSHIRQGHITHGDYFWPIWRTLWAHRFPHLCIAADEQVIFEGRGFALIGMIARYSAGMRILARARPDDGLLDLCIFPCASRTQILMHALRVFARRHLTTPGLQYVQCRTVAVSSPDAVDVEIDGEYAGTLPVRCSVQPGAATYLDGSECSMANGE